MRYLMAVLVIQKTDLYLLKFTSMVIHIFEWDTEGPNKNSFTPENFRSRLFYFHSNVLKS